MDPCAFLLHGAPDEGGPEKLLGIILVEIDDLLMMGQKKHDRKMEDLQRRFRFGKMENVDEKGVGFNGRRLRMEKGRALIDMEKFVSERMEEIVVSAERRKQADFRGDQRGSQRVWSSRKADLMLRQQPLCTRQS